jgi:pimeloyl-ACP methyl ester carboxylesterase
MTADNAPPELLHLYGALSPDGPEHFAVVFNKLHASWVADTGLEVADLAHVTAPTLILASDSGAMTFGHVGDVHATLPDSQVAIVPGTSHGLGMEKPHIVNRLILDFLADEQVQKMFALPEA